jgi:segregation and condensation protein A
MVWINDMNHPFPIMIQDFEGPLDLLLHLIETQKIPIADIKLAQITDQYLAYLRDSLAQQMEVASEFIVMASTLIAIKARSLLPQPQKKNELIELDEALEEDLEARLKERLLAYRAYKEAAIEFKRREQFRQEQSSRMPISLEPYREYPVTADFLAGLTIAKLQKTFQMVVERMLDDPDVEVFRDLESVPMRMARIERRLLLGPVTYYQLLESNTRKEWVTVFMSLLELIHLRKVMVKQERMFADIWIEKV